MLKKIQHVERKNDILKKNPIYRKKIRFIEEKNSIYSIKMQYIEK